MDVRPTYSTWRDVLFQEITTTMHLDTIRLARAFTVGCDPRILARATLRRFVERCGGRLPL